MRPIERSPIEQSVDQRTLEDIHVATNPLTLRPIKVLLTSCGCPGASTLIRELRHAAYRMDNREVEIIGIDCDGDAIGRFFCDEFRRVSPYIGGMRNAVSYRQDLFSTLVQHRPDIILPENATEAHILSRSMDAIESFGAVPLVSAIGAIEACNNKVFMYRACDGQPYVPHYVVVHSLESFNTAVAELGYPDKPVCFKPPISKGSRGFRIMNPNVDRVEQLLRQKPNARYTSLEEMNGIFGDTGTFPTLMVMEYLDGQEVTADVLCMDGEPLLTTVKTVEQARWGVIVKGELVDRPDIVDITKDILSRIPLSYCVNIQFIGDKLIEINPRVSSFIYQPDLTIPYLASSIAAARYSSINDEPPTLAVPAE